MTSPRLMMPSERPALDARYRFAVCALLALFGGDYARAQLHFRPVHPDFGQVWFAARAVLHGQNPYALIGPGLAFQWEAPLFYPLPAALVALPLAPLPEGLAVFCFAALGVGLFSWAVTEHGWSGLWAITSLCLLHAVLIAQWSPLLAGAFIFAPLSVVLIAKPTVGAAVFAAKPSWWALGGAVVLTLLAFLLQPGWVTAWRHALAPASVGEGQRFPYLVPLFQPGGIIVLAAITRWRRPEARLLVALACVPQTMLPYEGTLLFLIPRGWKQMVALSALSWGIRFVVVDFLAPKHLTDTILAYAPVMVVLLYLPCTLMVLRRPNEGTVPAWLEQRLRVRRAWLSSSG